MHPYTHGLFRAVPRLGHAAERLEAIPGTVPNPAAFPTGCKFHPRCDLTCRMAKQSPSTVEITVDHKPVRVMATCVNKEPVLRQVSPGHWAACHYAENYSTSVESPPSLEHRREVVAESLIIEEGSA
jgi:oligopeptide/dipeptide ABC transporter ATP-binding protein